MKTDATLKSEVLTKVMNQAVNCSRFLFQGVVITMALLFSSSLVFAQSASNGDEPLVIVKKEFYPGEGVIPAEVQSVLAEYAAQQSLMTMGGETEPSGTPPTIETCPADQTVECFGNVGHTASELEYTINCGPNGIIIIYEPPGILETGSCPGTEYVVTYDVWDQCGNNVTCEQTFTIENPAPEITFCPEGGIIASADEAVSDVDALQFTFSCPDDPLCSDITVTVDYEEMLDPCLGDMFIYTYTITDACGRSDECEQVYTIPPPELEIVCPSESETVECASDITPMESDVELIGLIDGIDYELMVGMPQLTSGDPDCPGAVYTVTYTVTDDCEREASCTSSFVISNDAPTITAPDAVTIECAADAAADIDGVSFTTSCDLVGEVTVVGPNLLEGDGFCDGSLWEFVYTVTDDCGRTASASQQVTISNEGPTITAPDAVTIECAADAAADIDGVSFTTSCGFDGEVTADGPNLLEGDGFCDGSLWEFVYTVTDDCGRTASASQQVTISNEGPTITAPDAVTIECAADAAADIDGVSFTTSCGFDGEVTADGPNLLEGDGFCNGSIWEFVYTVTDDCGRTASASQQVTISNEGASLEVPADATISCIESTDPSNTGMATATEACVGELFVSFEDVVVEEACPVVIERTWSAESECGGTLTGVQVITVVDDEAPVLNMPDVTEAEVSCSQLPLEDAIAFAEGTLSPEDEAEFIAQASALFVEFGLIPEGAEDECGEAQVVEIGIEASIPQESCPVLVELTCIFVAIDDCENESEPASTSIFIIDNTAPVITCPNDISVSCEEGISTDVTGMATATDDCSSAEITYQDVVVSEGCPMIIERTFTATDDCELTSSCTQEIIVTYDMPTIVAPDDVIIECAADAAPDIAGVVSTTACDLGGTVTADGPTLLEGDGFCDGSLWEIVYTVTDGCGRSVSDSQLVNIENDGPSITAPDDVEVICIDDFVANADDATVEAACELTSEVVVSDPVLIEGQGSCNLTQYEVTYTVTDQCDRASSDVQIVTCVNTGLDIFETPEDGIVTCYEDIVPDPWAIEYFSPCSSDVFIQVTPPTQLCCTEDCPGAEYLVIYTITNDCGDEEVIEQIFTIENDGPTIISCGENETVESVDDIVVSVDDVVYETACGTECEVTVVSEPMVVDLGCDGVNYVYTYSVNDDCGRTATCERTFNIPSDDPNCQLDDDCSTFSTFYADINGNQTTLYSVDFTPSEALLTFETEVDFSAHIAFDAVNSVVYLVNDNGSSILAYDPATDTELFDLTIGGNINQLFAVVYNPSDELIYVGDANDDEIYTIDPLGSGDINFFADGPVEGGDLAIQDGMLYLVNRGNSNLYTLVADADGIPDGVSEATLVGNTDSPNISGMAQANNTTSFILSNGNSSNFTKVNATTAATENVYMAMFEGEVFELASGGDMAAGCANNFGIEPCSYRLYYAHNPEGTSDYSLLQVELDPLGNATFTTLLEDLGSTHIGLSNDGSEIYMVGGSNVRTYDVESGTITNDVNIFNGANENNLSGFPAAVVGPDNQLFIAGAGNNVWLCDPMSGEATNIAEGINVNGGDLIFAPTGEEGAEELWIITRNNGTFTRVLDPENGSFSVDVSEINGAAVLENGNVLLADGDGNSLLKEVSLMSLEVVETYDIGLPLFNGDLAGGCTGEAEVVALSSLDMSFTFPASVYPNPSTDDAVITFEPIESARTQVELFDLSGRPMQSLFNADVKSGLEYRVNVNTRAFENGIYIYRITNGSHQVTKKLMVVD